MFGWFRKTKSCGEYVRLKEHHIAVYPNSKSCIKPNMRHVKAEQMPPLMVRKAAWRR